MHSYTCSRLSPPLCLTIAGTPSDLLPLELGKCKYETGTDGKMLHVLTAPDTMRCEYIEKGWTAKGLLDRVATASPPYHALIDTGALITGLSNYQVAQYLLQKGLHSMEGCVFMDDQDRKMILLR